MDYGIWTVNGLRRGLLGLGVVGTCLAMIGCGAAVSRPVKTAEAVTVPAPTAPVSPGGGMQISGTLGTIPARKVQATLERLLPDFQRCFAAGAQEVEPLFGEVEFAFSVNRDGAVDSAYLRQSNVGNWTAERCLLGIARGVRFPKPRGGDRAELTWGFAMDAPEDVRPPVSMDGSRLGQEAATAIAALQACEAPATEITVYLAPGGQVLSAGLAGEVTLVDGQVDCLLSTIRNVVFADPGSYLGKASLSLP